MKIIGNNENNLQLSNELDIELSVIDSGIVITELEGEAVIIIKDAESMISGLKETESLKIGFDYIDRPEFPSINCELKIRTKKGLSVKYGYFFNTESGYELNLLEKIINQREVYLYLFSDILIMSFIVQMEEKEKESLSEILGNLNI